MLPHLLRIFGASSRRWCSSYTTINHEQEMKQRFIELYSRYLDLSKKQATALLQQNPNIWGAGVGMSYDEIESSLKFLTANFSKMDVINNPTCILKYPATYENRRQVLHECLFHTVRLPHLLKYVSLMNKNVTVLKACNCILQESDLIENLMSQWERPIVVEKTLTERMTLNDIRIEIMNSFLQSELDMNNEEIQKARKIYKNLKHRSFKSIAQMLDILLKELKFNKERIIKNAFVLHARPENVREIIASVPRIEDIDIREILHIRPKIMIQSAKNIREIVGHIKEFNIPESSITKCFEIFTLSPETVHARLAELHNIKEFNVMFSNPRILRLVHHHSTAKSRLEYLQQLKVRCFSLNILSGTTELFKNYIYQGEWNTNGKDIIEYVSKHFKVSARDVRSVVHLHPHWMQVPLVSIKQTIEFLDKCNISKADMLENMLLLFYPISRIEPKLKELLEWEAQKGEDDRRTIVSISQLLNLCLYFIESEYHFTGDAVYESNRCDSKHDVILPPDPPKYLVEQRFRRYGTYKYSNSISQQVLKE